MTGRRARAQERLGPPRLPDSALVTVTQDIKSVEDDIRDSQRSFNGSVLALCEWSVSSDFLTTRSAHPINRNAMTIAPIYSGEGNKCC